jgi:hypothetical protein
VGRRAARLVRAIAALPRAALHYNQNESGKEKEARPVAMTPPGQRLVRCPLDKLDRTGCPGPACRYFSKTNNENVKGRVAAWCEPPRSRSAAASHM